MDLLDFIRKFQSTLPQVRKWIDDLLDGYKDHATPIVNLDFPQLKKVFPEELLKKAKVVVVSGKVPIPPLSDIGLPELSQIESLQLSGVTYKDIFFINVDQQSESLYFHELVHVIQWEKLGVDNFLIAYVIGLIKYGYENSPLEQMAYSLQRRFDDKKLSYDIVEFIRQETASIWNYFAPHIEKV